jgi:cobalt-zinc-cadmium efflux system outer membrane protein
MRRSVFALTLALAVPSWGCASTSARPAFDDVAKATAARGAAKIAWRRDSEEDERAERAWRELLARELSAETAVQIALLNNRELQGTFEELGIAQADLVQAGLLKNPVFGATVRVPLDPGHVSNLEFNVVQDFVDLVFLSARKRIAASQLEAVKRRVGGAVMKLARDVELAFYRAQGQAQVVAMRRIVAQAAEAAAELARRQVEAGTLSDLDAANELAMSEQVMLELSRSENEAVAAREELVKLLGLWGPDVAQLKLPDRLPEIPQKDPPLERLETIAIEKRLDLASATRDVETLSHALALAKNSRWVPGASAGVSFERKPEGTRLVGPTASVEVPLFDQRQAAIARLEAQLRQAKLHEEALAVEIRSQVRAARARLVATRATAERYKTRLVPLRERIVQLSEQQYHAMLIGPYQLLQAKQNEVAAYRDYIEAVRDYWVARADLEGALGTKLSVARGDESRARLPEASGLQERKSP